nr:MAG TPA: hypothetical protein [Caudoviricetes sp.]
MRYDGHTKIANRIVYDKSIGYFLYLTHKDILQLARVSI